MAFEQMGESLHGVLAVDISVDEQQYAAEVPDFDLQTPA
jgi:hypothetical protein